MATIKTGDILNYAYTGAVQSVTLPKGVYKLEVWGAQGGSYGTNSTGGNGGYSIGIITLTAETVLYIYVGGQGTYNTTPRSFVAGGFNGGGKAGYHYGGSGGGASDIRIGTDSLYSRVIVAGGAGGGSGFVWTGSNAPSGYLLGSEYYLTDASTIAGNASMPSTSGGTETGHTGNGYARITAIKVDSLNLPVNIGGTWKEANEAFVNIGGTWKTVEAAFVNIGGTWKELG